ncbi:PP2C family protein-serine/threonine phosphatase [Streptomyces sp. NPDC048389]|uniref:PP2C family protein-serine/threonine phosphatase n=1 Tax=Streptomyces sp. NPDC048389 TaxID=3154622 RepID=UPI003455CDCD
MTEHVWRSGPLSDLAGLRRAVRGLAAVHGLPVETRARLAVSAAAVARPSLALRRTVHVTALYVPGDGRSGPRTLSVRLDHAAEAGPPPEGLPLPATVSDDGAVVWDIPLAASALEEPVAGDESDDTTEQELAAVLAASDALTTDHQRLKDELDETNSGVLALYVQLEERDEQLRRAHGQMLRALEDALRPAPLRVPGLELAVHYAPADTDAPTGGDLYDWFVLPDGSVHITIVDALGHGVRSTGSALNVTHAVRTLALDGCPLKSVVGRASDVLNGVDPDLMASVLLARIDPATGEMLLANGSHPPALVVRADGGAEFLEARGRGVGYPLPGSEQVLQTHLAPGDLVVLYTDGLTESRRDPLEGERRLISAATGHAGSPIEEIPGALAADMHTVVLHADDTLALALRCTGASGDAGAVASAGALAAGPGPGPAASPASRGAARGPRGPRAGIG